MPSRPPLPARILIPVANPLTAEELIRLTQQRLHKRGTIDQPTAIFVDKSGSMESAIAVGKMLASVCSAV